MNACRFAASLVAAARPAALGACLAALIGLPAAAAVAQDARILYGTDVSPEVRSIYSRGLNYLASTQQQDGSWRGGQQGGGVNGLCLMALLAHGDDPNFGPYSLHIRRALQNIIHSQDPRTGFIPNSMYHHGFAMLALAEAYGAVDEARLWDEVNRPRQRSIGEALDLAVRCAVTSQQSNRWGAWRYSPQSNDADTSVAGAVLVGLLAARNAGIEVPDESIERALQYFRSNTSDTGIVAYSGGVGGFGVSMNRSAIATLAFAIGKRKDWPEHQAALGYITGNLEHQEQSYPYYFRYYMAQALFQSDVESWHRWKTENVRMLQQLQAADGSFQSGKGDAYATAMALLSLALEFRFLPIYER